jgi:hypothetical protein
MEVEAVEVKAEVKAMEEVMVMVVEDKEEEEVDEARTMRPSLIIITMLMNGLH